MPVIMRPNIYIRWYLGKKSRAFANSKFSFWNACFLHMSATYSKLPSNLSTAGVLLENNYITFRVKSVFWSVKGIGLDRQSEAILK